MARRSNQKRNRDPNAPKKSVSAWQIFFNENREEVSKQNSNLSYRDITKKLGEMWRQSDDATKRRYQKQYESGRAEYSQKLSAYKDEQKKKRQSSNSKKNAKKGNNTNDGTNDNDDQM